MLGGTPSGVRGTLWRGDNALTANSCQEGCLQDWDRGATVAPIDQRAEEAKDEQVLKAPRRRLRRSGALVVDCVVPKNRPLAESQLEGARGSEAVVNACRRDPFTMGNLVHEPI